jgi:alcohol dehydrogenase (cytochrome c)
MKGAILLCAMLATSSNFLLAQQQTSAVTVTTRVSAEDLLAHPVGANWPSYNGDYSGRRYSTLDEINVSNVSRLRAEWVFHPGNTERLR